MDKQQTTKQQTSQTAGRKRHILLAYPRNPDTYWSFRHALKFVGKKAIMPPLGLLTVAAIMGDSYAFRLVDTNVRPLTDDDLVWADMVFLSAMIVQRESLEELIHQCRLQGVPVVAGGPFPTACHEEIEGVDHFVLGEAECTLPEFLRDLESGTPRSVYLPTGRPEITDVPVPRFDLCDLDAYETLPLQFSRGCPFDCEFCDIVALFGHRVRTKTADQMMLEMDAVYNSGFEGSIFVVDDNFIGNRSHVKELLRRLTEWQIERGHPYRLSTEASIDLAADQELLDLMVSSGFGMVFVGLETPVEESLASAGKQQNLRQSMGEAVHHIQQAGIEVTGGFIVGFDSDPDDVFERQIEFIQEVAVPTAMVGLLMALPNTRLWKRLEEEGRIVSRSSGDNTHRGELNFETRLPRDFLVQGYQQILGRIYQPRQYFARSLKMLRTLPKTVSRSNGRRRHSRPGKRVVTALYRSFSIQGLSRYAVWYWLFLLRAIAIRPRLFERIFTTAIQGHHFFVITRKMLLMGASPSEEACDPVIQ